MTQQPATSRTPVAIATFFLVLTAGAFAAAFFTMGGVDWIAGALKQASGSPTSASASAVATGTANPGTLVLPAGMDEEFALRLWQEQLDSQEMIRRLVSGQITSLKIDRVEKSGDEARLHCTVKPTQGASVAGVIQMRRFGEDWYVAGATARRDGPPAAATPVPSVDDVDVEVLNTIVAEHRKSQNVIAEYLDGTVKEVFIERVTDGPKTVTMEIEMDETHGEGYAQLVAIEIEVDGEPAWFLARFDKTGHNPPHL